MPVHSYATIAGFILLGIYYLYVYFQNRNKGLSMLGKPSIDRFYFYTGKFALFTSWILFLVKAIIPDLGYIKVPGFLAWFAVILLWSGSFIMVVAMYELGQSLRIGLPNNETLLVTRGPYHLSRNPLYIGVFMINIGSCFYFPDLINICFALYGMIIHHRIIRGEEQYLSQRFGREWEDYAGKVRRYL
jgi:protein-S-isoprenylcysteine O-methyltransferase Ste14